MIHIIIFTAFVLTILFSCKDTKTSDKQIELKAIAITNKLDKNSIDTFKHWSYGTRGQAEIWGKLDSPSYSCFFFNKDTLEIFVGQIENFKRDFPFSRSIDTSIFQRANFKKLNDTEIKVMAKTNFGRDTVLIDKINLTDFFLINNPFKRIENLSNFKDGLGILGTFYRPDIGNFIQFYLSRRHILTYLPDDLYIDPKFKNVWLDYFSSGNIINKNWNLRKLETAIDNG